MGFGDEIMAAGEARRAQAHDARPVAILDKYGRPRWHPLWLDNPRIARPETVMQGLDVQSIVNGPGCRPYLDYARMEAEFAAVFPGRLLDSKIRDPRLPWRYRSSYRAALGELYIECAPANSAVVVEPSIKRSASPNKDWGWARWQSLIDLWPELDWVQLGPPETRLLRGVRHIETESFLSACTALAGARAAVLPEGGLHHAAAALGVPAVVIFGGFVSPSITGYAGQIAHYRPHADGPCGQRIACRGCRASMDAITPRDVADSLEVLLCSSAKVSTCPTANATWSDNCGTSAKTRV